MKIQTVAVTEKSGETVKEFTISFNGCLHDAASAMHQALLDLGLKAWSKKTIFQL